MRKIKETITALTESENSGIVRVSRKEQLPVPYERMELVFKFILKISAIASVTAIVLYAEIWKLLALLVFGILFSLFYFCMRD